MQVLFLQLQEVDAVLHRPGHQDVSIESVLQTPTGALSDVQSRINGAAI